MRSHSTIEQSGWVPPATRDLVARRRGKRRLDRSHASLSIVVSIGTLVAVLTMTLARLATAQEADLNAPSTQRSQKHTFLGVDRCERCHQAPTPADIGQRITDFVLLNESKTWTSDIHSRAYQFIDPATNPFSKQICDKLEIPDISQAQQCLSCHSNWLTGEVRPPTYQRGVACESCHGPSEHWDVPHSLAEWRKKPVAEKEDLGMIDVRNPIERAQQCFGCHIGNAAEGKVITHEMYAAGHPPLPGIEIESFAQQMPRHWRYLEEKVVGSEIETKRFTHYAEFVGENHQYLNFGNERIIEQVEAHKHRAAAVVLGGAIALREHLELMRDMAGGEDLAKYPWPTLATFDCRDCHHELATPSRRQEQRVGSVPGRPTIPKWPTTLVRLAISHASDDTTSAGEKLAQFHAKLTAVHTELERSPFGSPARLEQACSELLEWLDTAVIAPALAKPFDSGAVTASFRLLIDIGSDERHDFDSARQIAWAMRILSCGISKTDARKAIDDSLETLTPALRLGLPNRLPDQCDPVPSTFQPRDPTSLTDHLPTALAVPNEYDADCFREQLQKLRQSLQ